MAEPLFLITGASGDTGRYAALTLREKGAAVRALVHQMDERANALQRAGIEVVQGDLLNLDDARRALEGVTAAYFVYPIRPGLMEASAYFAQAAKEAGTSALVNMSQISARRNATSNAARVHWVAERVFDWSGIAATHLKPTFFAQWLTYPLVARAVKESGLLALPFGSGEHAPIAAEDQGRVIAAILTDPDPHRGQSYHLHGPMQMNHAAIADILSAVIGYGVKYVPIPIDEFRLRLQQNPNIDPYFVQHICAVAQDYQDGVFAGTNDVVERLTGAPSMTVEAYVRAHAVMFAR